MRGDSCRKQRTNHSRNEQKKKKEEEEEETRRPIVRGLK